MNNKIANIVVGYIKELPWIDKIAGLTQIGRVTQGTVEKRFPISCDLTFDDACTQGCYDELMPNSQYGSVVFFEDVSFNLVGQEGNKLHYVSRINLVAWLNYKKIPGGCGSSGDYIISIIKALPAFPQNIGDMLRLSVSVTSQAQRSSGIFSKYTFDEKQAQFMLLPYDFFSLDIKTEFYIIPECPTLPLEGCNEC